MGPLKAQAGFLSFMANAFSFGATNSAEESAVKTTSQTMDLLEAPTPGSTTRDITILADSAILSDGGPSGAIPFNEGAVSNHISTYVVKSGDSIASIAALFQVSANTVRWANNLTPQSVIKPGDTLVILPISGVRYTVKKGDTLKSIATAYHGDVEDIIQYNGLSSASAIKAGDIIMIPDGEPAAAPTSVPSKIKSTLQAIVGFFMRPSLGSCTQGIHGHNGVDIGSSHGAPIYAAAGGTVIVSKGSGWNGGYGQYIVVSHSNGTQTLYAHLSQVLVSVGAKISQGQQIAKMGNTGAVNPSPGGNGTHLHFEVRGAKNPFCN